MRFPLDGSVELHFTHSPEDRPRAVSNVSCDKSPCAIASWDSYENINFTMEQVDEQGKVQLYFLFWLPVDAVLLASCVTSFTFLIYSYLLGVFVYVYIYSVCVFKWVFFLSVYVWMYVKVCVGV